jgi:hypothetical protein
VAASEDARLSEPEAEVRPAQIGETGLDEHTVEKG